MIEIKHLKEEPCELYGPDGNLIGVIETELDFSDVRLQILEQKAEGYFFMFRGKKYDIDRHGGINNWLRELFDGVSQMASKIIMGGLNNDFELSDGVKKMRGGK